LKSRVLSIFLLSLLVVLPWRTPQATTLADFTFETDQQEQDFRALIEELRCLVCQNESLAGSQAELAQDLRREVYDLLRSGKDKQQVIEFLVARYGDFVLYKPPVKPSTYPLWFGPFLLFGIALLVFFRVLRGRQQSTEAELSEQDKMRLEKLLKDNQQD
jgi:cytochrome c-type biogenesis protein CcmH